MLLVHASRVVHVRVDLAEIVEVTVNIRFRTALHYNGMKHQAHTDEVRSSGQYTLDEKVSCEDGADEHTFISASS